jgi:Tfp pilus assembly protein PilN
MPKNKAINLLPQEEFSASITGRILKWATSTFRVIVTVTEMVVMGAFLSRFWLDAQNSNLNSAIKIKSAEISAQASLEEKFRIVQTKLNLFDKIAQTQKNSAFVEKISGNVPENTTLTRISIQDGKIEIRGTSFSDYNIVQFIANLGSSFKGAALQQANSSKSNPGGTDFVIEVTN